jgi:CheY-like chemotaxis protein
MTAEPSENLPAEAASDERARADRGLESILSQLGHELRNPIAAIAMAAEALSRLCTQPDQKSIADVVRRQSLQASRLVDELLDLSRISRGTLQLHRERLDLLEQIRHVVDARRTALEAQRLSAEMKLPAGAVWIDADRTRISQVFGSLVEYTIAITAAGGRLVVSCDVDQNLRQARTEVRAIGVSVQPHALAELFEPFGQHHRTRSGLGLALAKGLVEMQGGVMEATIEANTELCFRVLMPVRDAPTDERHASHSHRAMRILIIDDTPDIVESLQFLLEQSGHEISSAPDGKLGIHAAQTLKPDVVLCDIGLPGMDGNAVARQLRADPATASIYLIAVSGFAGEEDRRRSLEAGFDMHLNKPQGFAGLNDLLQTLPIDKR